MSIDIQQFTTTDVISIPFGMRLKSAREARGLESKDVAAQLRLSEKMISMIEKETYPPDLPITFIRGYIRAYARLMEISDSEITKALEPLKQPTILADEDHDLVEPQPVTSGNYFMQFFTYLILLTILSLVGVWWYSQSSSNDHSVMTTEMPITQNTTDNSVAPFNAGPRETAASAGPTISTVVEASENTIQLPGSRVVVEMITGLYALQFLVHFILLLLIGLFLLWAQARSIKKPNYLLTTFMFLSLISLVPLWWYYYSQFISPAYALKTIDDKKPVDLAPTDTLKTRPATEVSPVIGSTPTLEEKTQSVPSPIPTTIINDEKTTNEKTKQDLSQTTNNNLQNADETAKAKTTPKPSSSGLYTPVPSTNTKRHSGKYRKNTHVMAPHVEQTRVASATAENEFADLDKDDNY